MKHACAAKTCNRHLLIGHACCHVCKCRVLLLPCARTSAWYVRLFVAACAGVRPALPCRKQRSGCCSHRLHCSAATAGSQQQPGLQFAGSDQSDCRLSPLTLEAPRWWRTSLLRPLLCGSEGAGTAALQSRVLLNPIKDLQGGAHTAACVPHHEQAAVLNVNAQQSELSPQAAIRACNQRTSWAISLIGTCRMPHAACANPPGGRRSFCGPPPPPPARGCAALIPRRPPEPPHLRSGCVGWH
jgi:hypothetical protein